MTNAELIKALRRCSYMTVADALNEDYCKPCAYFAEDTSDITCIDRMMIDAAAALEAAEKRIARLEDDLRNSTISNPERFKIYGYTVKDLLLFADMCKRNDVREADLKQAARNLELAVRAVMNERQEIIKNTMDKIAMRFTPDFEKAFKEMRGVNTMEKLKPCPRCGDAWLYERDEPKPYTINCKCGYAFYVTEWSKTKEEAIAAWNRRVDNEQIH